MELFYSPMACSLASHITLREAGLDAALTSVTLATKTTAAGDDYFAVAAKGQVPALRLDDGTLLTENAAILQYLADRRPEAGLLAPVGARERYAVLEWVSFFGTEVHKACLWPIFNPGPPEETKAWARTLLDRKLEYVASALGDRAFLVGDRFTIADAYLTWILALARVAKLAVPEPLERYRIAMHERSAVREAVAIERAALAAAIDRAAKAAATSA